MCSLGCGLLVDLVQFIVGDEGVDVMEVVVVIGVDVWVCVMQIGQVRCDGEVFDLDCVGWCVLYYSDMGC